MPVIDNESEHRFELAIGEELVIAEYGVRGNSRVITHVEAPQVLRGTGAAGQLMEGVMAIARQRDLKLIPQCSYAVAWMKRHPENNDLLA